ncbi:hypothetical protein ARMGADRAFT_568989 [Armillaria gallica]|uniref:Uncharacterized protein n=1 Tax=Armillaria gallica TaxID=47427 RepID=A0A2H3E353_ARMGA|nr:hypothetical protein ARMGADRAFT_568989 [Armillaria gallica]
MSSLARTSDFFHYHQYNRIGDESLNIIGVFSASSKHEYAIRMYYSEEQRLWLAEYGPAFEQAVLGHIVLPFFEGLCQEFFCAWPKDESEMLMEEERIADEEQRKIEIFTLYIMGLKQLWLYHQRAPDGWDYRMVIQQLDNLEDIITHEF